MSKRPSSITALLWLLTQRKNKQSTASRIRPEAMENISADLPNGTDEERLSWLIRREETNEEEFSPIVYRPTDLSKLTATEKLEYVNTGKLPAPKPTPRSSK
jgi:hypothetical protein